MSGRLADEEFRLFRELLKRYCEHDLDQWETWRTETAYGTVYILLSRAPLPGSDPETYDQF